MEKLNPILIFYNENIFKTSFFFIFSFFLINSSEYTEAVLCRFYWNNTICENKKY